MTPSCPDEPLRCPDEPLRCPDEAPGVRRAATRDAQGRRPRVQMTGAVRRGLQSPAHALGDRWAMASEKTKSSGDRVIARNRRASFNYELGEKFEAGLVLVGTEVKMLRIGTADLTDTWCSIQQG